MNAKTMTLQEKKPLISVIVPIFQMEKYLDKCISSIIAQSYDNLEIILVDDGSDDNSPAICDKYQAEDSRVKVIHKKNGGLSQARNYGLRVATGNFIGFVDSDDWIEPNMYELLLSALLDTGADIAVCNFKYEFQKATTIPKVKDSARIQLYSSEEALRMIIKWSGFIRTVVWNKLYKRSILDKLKFPNGKLYEDNLWTAQAIGNAKSIVCINIHLYHYLIRADSLSHNGNLVIKGTLDKIEMQEQRLAFLHEHYPTLEKIAIVSLLNILFRKYMIISENGDNVDPDWTVRRCLHGKFCELGARNILYYDKPKEFIIRIIFWFSPQLLLKIYTIFKKCMPLRRKKQPRCSIT